ncbi:hypothetical protein LXA43DRAFT_908153 [Ganoderma leucocontextum]|nr:hypothetical protein LXA43DRAFT_908153 [Ganoderma leucocontextum]
MANTRFGSTILAGAENIIIIPLYAITMVYISLTICFTTWDFDPDTHEEHEICCFRFTDLPPHLDPRPKVPILFKVIGQIALEDCFLTADGYECPESSGAEDEHLATCWIETRPDYISETYWLGVVPAVQEIANHIPTDVDTSKLIGEDEGQVRLQVCYQPPAGQSITSTLPLYNIRGERQVPSCISEVPFGHPMRVAFALECRYCRDEPECERVLVAMLEHMTIV